MSVHVLAPGLATTLQDSGRHGLRHLGVGTAGALDPWAHALANRLVGNADEAATLEIALSGPRLRFDPAVRIALCGARIDAQVGDMALPCDRPIDLSPGCELRLGACRSGARAYLAVAGGFALPMVLGSASTDLRGGFGGMRGRALASGDVLPLARGADRANAPPAHDAPAIAPWWIDAAHDPDAPPGPPRVRLLPGDAGTAPHGALFARTWRVSASSDRQGLRLQCDEADALRSEDATERISEPVFPGAVQLPPDGNPIVLLADAQTHGGYPRIGHAIRADASTLAQLRPGDALRLEPCTPEQARAALQRQQQRFARIAMAIAARYEAGR